MAVQAGCSISEMGRRIPSSEWPVFLAFYEMEPWGFEADDYHSARISMTVANMSGRFKHACSLDDFLTPKPLTEAQQIAYNEAKGRYE